MNNRKVSSAKVCHSEIRKIEAEKFLFWNFKILNFMQNFPDYISKFANQNIVHEIFNTEIVQ